MKSSYIKWGLGAIAAGVAVVLLDAWFLEKYFFQVKEFNIGKKESTDKIRMVLLTDLHFKKTFHSYHQRLVRKINELRPDLMLMAGDLIDQHGEPDPARKFFKGINAAIPILAIPGNHDHKNKVSIDTLKTLLQQHHGQLLINETVQLHIRNVAITVTGLDDFIEGESCFADAVQQVGKEPHHLLLIHSPLQQEGVRKELQAINRQRTADQQLTIPYIFAGHNHGGQIRFGSFVPVLPEKSGQYVDGWYNSEKPYLFVSKGFGTSSLPFRLGARPELVLFHYGV